MDVGKVLSALDSDSRLRILKIVSKSPCNVQDVMDELRREGHPVKYRETVYRALEILTDAEILKKGYDKDKGICYAACMKRITINLEGGNIECT